MASDEVSVPLNPDEGNGVDVADDAIEAESLEHHEEHYSHKSLWLRAAVLGASDGLVTGGGMITPHGVVSQPHWHRDGTFLRTANISIKDLITPYERLRVGQTTVGALVTGIATASANQRQLLLSALAGMIAGSLSMALGEFVSISQQADSEKADVELERQAQLAGPVSRAQELQELTDIYIERGLEPDLAREVAEQLTAKDAVRAHARDELGIDIDDHPSPWVAAFSSMVSFSAGSGLPTLALLLPTNEARLWGLLITVTVGLILFGGSAAWMGGISPVKGAIRMLLGGWLAMAFTAGVGSIFGTDPA